MRMLAPTCWRRGTDRFLGMPLATGDGPGCSATWPSVSRARKLSFFRFASGLRRFMGGRQECPDGNEFQKEVNHVDWSIPGTERQPLSQSLVSCRCNELTSVVDVVRVIGNGTIEVTVETKNSEQDDDNATTLSGSSGAISTAGRTPFTVGASIDSGTTSPGFLELARYVYSVGGTQLGDGVHFRMQNPSWLSH